VLRSERISDGRLSLRSRDHLTNVSLFTHGFGRNNRDRRAIVPRHARSPGRNRE
jgi:hypothetical protein